MDRLNPEKLHVTHSPGISMSDLSLPRRYTLTHSDMTGDLFLTIDTDYDKKQVSGFYTRLMRDEVFAEIQNGEGNYEFGVYCHISGGFVFGTAGMRFRIFQKEMPLVMESFRYGDRQLFENNKELDKMTVMVYYHSANPRYHQTINLGYISDYR